MGQDAAAQEGAELLLDEVRRLHNHHIEYRSDGGPDDLWNRTALCAAHHPRAVHQGIGRIRIRGRAPDGLRFELPLATFGPGERILR